MTLADIRGWVRDKLQDTNFATSLIDFAANAFVDDLFSQNRTRLMEESDQLFLSAGDTEVDLPDDYQVFIPEGTNVTSPQVYNMKDSFMEYGDFMTQYPGYKTYTANQITYWTTYGNTIRLCAPLDADSIIDMDYVRTPAQMTVATSVCEVPDQYAELVVVGTLIKCMQTNEDYQESDEELQNLNRLRLVFIRNEARGAAATGPRKMRTNRRRHGGRAGDPSSEY